MRYSHGSLIFKDSQLEKGQPFGDALRLHAKLDREEKELVAAMQHPDEHHKDQRKWNRSSNRRLLLDIDRKVTYLMTQLDEVTQALATLTEDLEGLAASAKAEFDKLETELAEQPTPVEVDLEPLKASIEALDSKAKSAAADVPTN